MGTATNMGTSRANDGYLSITAHYISPQFVTFHRNLQCCPFPSSHNAVNIATMLQKVTGEWGINLALQIPAFTCDNVKNVMNAVNENLMFVAIPLFGTHSQSCCATCISCPRTKDCFGKG